MEGNYGFIGLGTMGYGMASNIRQKMPSSSKMYIYDLDNSVCERFVTEVGKFGAVEIASSAKEVAANARVVVSSLPNVQAVRDTYLSDTEGVILATPDPDRLILETSTIESLVAREMAVSLAAMGAGCYIDTPVSGGPPAAAAGKLSFMIGRRKPEEGDEEGQRLQRVLEMMGDAGKLFWCGKIGAGLAAKISNNYIACSVLLAVAEATAIGVRSGIEPELLHEVIHSSSGQTFMGDIMRRIPKAALEGSVVFPIDLMVKDIALSVKAGHETDVNPRMALAAQAIWTESAENPDTLYWDGFGDSR